MHQNLCGKNKMRFLTALFVNINDFNKLYK